MGRGTPILAAFNGGETSPKTDGRVDLEGYYRSCSELRNMFPLIQGPATKRPGSKYINGAKFNSTIIRLIPFQYSAGDNYILEFGEYYLRFYTQGGVVMSGGSPYELVSPYQASDLDLVKFVQMADVLYLVHPLYPPYKLSRLGATSWTLAAVDIVWGPFLELNTTATTVTPSALTGAGITLTASTSIFDSSHVGSFWKLVHDYAIQANMTAAGNTVGPMEVNAAESMILVLTGTWVGTVNLERSYDSGSTWLIDLSLTANTNYTITGLEDGVLYRLHMPAHTSGTATGRLVKREQAGYVEIVGYTSGTVLTADVIEDLYDTTATTKWAEGAFSDVQGYPAAIRFYEQRLELMGTVERPATIWASKVDDYENFETGSTDAHAYSYTLAGSRVNQILWGVDHKVLFIGTVGDEWKFGFADDPTTNSNVDAKKESEHGSSSIQARLIENTVVFVESGGKALRSIYYNYDENGFIAPRISDHAEHLFLGGIVEMDFSQQPYPILWLIRSDGVLVSCTLSRAAEIIAFAQQQIGGTGTEVESLAVVRGDDRDEVWIAVKRTVDGSTVRYVEQFQSDEFDDVEDSWFVDSGLNYDGWNATAANLLTITTGTTYAKGQTLTLTASGGHTPFSAGSVGQTYRVRAGAVWVNFLVAAYSSTTVVTGTADQTIPSALQATAVYDWAACATNLSGMDHLEGETVKVLADGAVHPEVAVASGIISLVRPAAVVVSGLGFRGLLKTKRIELRAGSGTSQGKKKQIFNVVARVWRTLTCLVGYDEDNLDEIFFRTTKTPLGSPPDLFTGDKELPLKDRGTNDGYIVIANDEPLPFTVVSISPTVYATEL